MRRRHAIFFILLLGLVSLFADLTYEGARSITGPYLALLGAGAGIVGIAAGAGELIGYTLRFVFGYLADRTRRYWGFTIVGYALNLMAVPMLALVNSWEAAVVLILLERTGKAIRVGRSWDRWWWRGFLSVWATIAPPSQHWHCPPCSLCSSSSAPVLSIPPPQSCAFPAKNGHRRHHRAGLWAALRPPGLARAFAQHCAEPLLCTTRSPGEHGGRVCRYRAVGHWVGGAGKHHACRRR